MIEITREAEFAASHHYEQPGFSAEENRGRFGACCRPHGHSYRVEVAVGVASPGEPVRAAIELLDRALKERVVARLNERDLNGVADLFGQRVPTTENVARAVWKLLEGETGEAELLSVRVHEDDDLFVAVGSGG